MDSTISLKISWQAGYKASGSAVMTSYRMLYKPAIMGKAVNKMGELKHVNNGVFDDMYYWKAIEGVVIEELNETKGFDDAWNYK